MPPVRRHLSLFICGLVPLIPFQGMADPSQAMALYPVFALSGRATDPEHMVVATESVAFSSDSSNKPAAVVPVVTPVEMPGDAFASADPEVEVDSSFVGNPSGGDPHSYLNTPGEPTRTDVIRDFQDTLIRTEQDTRVQTFVGADGQRLPESWALPPGSSAPAGGHPGSRYVAPGLDYSGNPGVTDYPPPVTDAPYRGSRYSYPYYSGYHPGGPYAYQYDGMVPLGDPGWYPGASYDFDADFSMFTRQFDPEQAHLKAGPFFFEALWVEAGVLYSDFNGPAMYAPYGDGGWLSYASFGFQMTARLNPSLYMTAQGEIIYLFGDNELGFRSGFGGGPFARLVYEKEIGSWDFTAFAEFGTGSFFGMFGQEAFEAAGRYSFGFLGLQETGLLYDPFLYTRLGVKASTLTSPDWRLTLSADHTDFWYVGENSNDDHSAFDRVGVLYGAEPDRVPFTPWFSYDAFTTDYFESVNHVMFVGASGRLSKNVEATGQLGYLFNTQDSVNNSSFLWNLGLRHQINERTSHGVWFGQGFFMNDFSIDSTVSSFFQYYVEHQFTERLRMNAYVQWSTDDFLTGQLAGGSYESEIYGVWLNYKFTERMTGTVGYLEEQRQDLRGGADFDRSLFQARLDASVGERSNVYFLYQHEDTDFYYEDLYMAGIRRYF
jgi:hypothetical protein